MQIKIFEGDYNKSKFYSAMGKFFAEPQYRKEMPYMNNKDSKVWFLCYEMNKFLGFGAIDILKNKAILESSFVIEEYRKNGIWKEINKARLKYLKDKKKTIEVITKEKHLKEYWIKLGFKEYRKSGRYFYLRKDIEK
jgi:hypothetical protein